MKLAIGTAQFGLDYGIANRQGQIAPAEALAIIEYASRQGIDMLDTAVAYGDSEQRLGEVGVGDWQVVSKLPSLPEDCDDITHWVRLQVEGSKLRLKIEGLYGLLLHRPAELLESRGAELYLALQQVKRDGLVQKIGISIYDPSELDALIDRYAPDLVQAPLNVFDRRIQSSGWMSRLHGRGIEIHTRSVFLQGLLLVKSHQWPRQFAPWANMWTRFDDWLKLHGVTPLQACLGFPMSLREVSKVIVGVDSLAQLQQIVTAAGASVPPLTGSLASEDLDLINPSRWNALT